MYIIVIGGGKIGYYLSRTLLSEGHEVLVIEKDQAKCQHISDELGSICIRGDGCEATTLAEAGTGRANMLIAVTPEDEDNLVSCQMAKQKFNVPMTIARLNNPKNRPIFKKLGIDVAVSSIDLILEHIEEEVPTHPLTHLLSLKDGEQEIVEVKVPPTSPVVGKRLKDIPLPRDSFLSLIIGKEKGAQLPTPNTIIEPDDRLIAVTRPELEGELMAKISGS